MKTLSLKRSIAFVAIALGMVIAFALFTTDTYADVKYEIDIPATLYHNNNYDESPMIWVTPDQSYYDEEGRYVSDIAPITAKSSNPKVIKVVKESGSYELVLKKSGKARITVTFKGKEGTKKTISKQFRVKKYPTLINSLRVNGKKMNIKKDMFNSEVYTKKTKTKATIKLSLKKGNKKEGIVGYYVKKNGDQVEMPDKELKKVMKGKTFKFPKKYKWMYVSISIGTPGDYRGYSIKIRRK